MKTIFNFAVGFAVCLIVALIITAIFAVRSGNGCMIAVCIMGGILGIKPIGSAAYGLYFFF